MSEQKVIPDVVVTGGRRTGKATAMEAYIRAFTRKNPKAVICRVSAGDVRVEKPVEQSDDTDNKV